MNNKFLVLTNIYDCTGYFIGWNCGRPVFLEEFQIAINFSKVSLHFNKIPNSLRQILQTYSETMHFFVRCKKKSSRSSQQRLISKCQGNLVMKLMKMWWNSYYSKFGSEIWTWLGIWGISFFIWFYNFLQMLWLYSSIDKKPIIYVNNFIVSPL